MKRIALMAVALALCASFAQAGGHEKRTTFTFTTNTVTTITNALDGVKGYIQEVLLDVSATSTGTVTMAAVSPLAGMANRNVAVFTAVEADAVYLPRFNATTSAGAALTTDAVVSEPFLMAGETLTITAVNTTCPASGVTYSLLIKYTDEK